MVPDWGGGSDRLRKPRLSAFEDWQASFFKKTIVCGHSDPWALRQWCETIEECRAATLRVPQAASLSKKRPCGRFAIMHELQLGHALFVPDRHSPTPMLIDTRRRLPPQTAPGR